MGEQQERGRRANAPPPQRQQAAPQQDEQAKLAAYLRGDAVQRKFAEVCRDAVKVEELVRLALIAASRQPQLLQCTQASILRALFDAHALGVAPLGIQGRGYLVPRKNKNLNGQLEAHFDPGWRGLCDIARRDGRVKRIDAKIVYQGDRFRYVETQDGPLLEHEPIFMLPNEEGYAEALGFIIAAYARATVEGEPQVEVLRRKDIDRIRETSTSGDAGPWGNWFDEMARKSAVRRMAKYLPYSPDLDKATRASDRADGADDEDHEKEVRTLEDLSTRITSRPLRALGARTASAQETIDAAPQAREAERAAPRRDERAEESRDEAPAPTDTRSSAPPASADGWAPAPSGPTMGVAARTFRDQIDQAEGSRKIAEIMKRVAAAAQANEITPAEYMVLDGQGKRAFEVAQASEA